MALSNNDLSNPLRFWSAKVVAKTSTTNTEILLFKIRSYTDATTPIVESMRRLSEDLYVSMTSSATDPTSYDVTTLTIFDKYSKQVVATWNKTDYTDAVAIFVNHAGTNGVNYSSWTDFTTAIINAINTI